MTFWIIISALTLVVAALLALVLLRARRSDEPPAAYDLRVYRDQLRDVDRDLVRGVIAQGDAERIRAEVSRRILAADTQMRAAGGGQDQSRGASVAMALLSGGLVIGGSFALYMMIGAPGYGDLSLKWRIEMAEIARAGRPEQAVAEAGLQQTPPQQNLSPEYLNLLERLRATVAARPDDLKGQQLLARNEAATGNFVAAYKAQSEVLRLKGDDAEAVDFTDYADMLILAAGGYVSPEAENALRAALERDPRNGPARYYWGMMMDQTGRPDVTFQIWSQLLREGPPDAPWILPIRAQIEEMAFLAGVDFTLPPATAEPPLRGPSAADVEAARDMTAEDRTEMIRGMVQGLSERLANEGGTPAEWSRLIGALGVLGDKAQAQAVYDNALEVFAENDEALETVHAGARQAGLLQ